MIINGKEFSLEAEVEKYIKDLEAKILELEPKIINLEKKIATFEQAVVQEAKVELVKAEGWIHSKIVIIGKFFIGIGNSIGKFLERVGKSMQKPAGAVSVPTPPLPPTP